VQRDVDVMKRNILGSWYSLAHTVAQRKCGVKSVWMVTAAAGVLLLAGCQPGGPVQNITRGDELYFNDFSQSASFEEGSYEGAVLRVRGGVYEIQVTRGDGTLWWGQWGDTFDDVIIDVDVEQTSERPETYLGVMCRVRGNLGQPRTPEPELAAIMADSTAEATVEMTPEATAEATAEPADAAMANVPNGDGYLFLLQGNGSYAIMRSRGRDIVPLVDWAPSDQVQPAPGRNHIRAICVGDYLALYVNDTFVAEARDDSFASGQVGLVAGAANRLGADIQFDNLSVAAPAR
jgi:hypothetical protein